MCLAMHHCRCFLAMALISLKLWELTDLAGPVLIILAVQTVVMICFAYFVTFKIMGSNYDSAVLAAGHCGFGMGATPTAVANMQSITDRYGASHKAFLIVPMVGAFFVDIVNATVLQIFTKLPLCKHLIFLTSSPPYRSGILAPRRSSPTARMFLLALISLSCHVPHFAQVTASVALVLRTSKAVALLNSFSSLIRKPALLSDCCCRFDRNTNKFG